MKKKILLSMIALTLIFTGCTAKVEEDTTNKDTTKVEQKDDNVQVIEETPEPEYLIDLESKSRPIGVMINNHPQARPNHVGLQDAYIIYEIIVEGGITRYYAIFKDQSTEKIGSIRSSRHYFLDYALENDAIYTHIGWSPQAQTDITALGIANLNGLYEGFSYRDNSLGVAYEHTAFAKMSTLVDYATRKGYRTETNKDLLFNYSDGEIDLSNSEGAIKAETVSIKYSDTNITGYKYDSENKVYNRTVNDVAHTDGITKEQYNFKNIITYKVKNSTIDSYGRQNISNVGSGTGYYITNGYAVPITWSKASRSSQTVYKLKNGDEIDVNNGNTFIQIQPSTQTLSIK